MSKRGASAIGDCAEFLVRAPIIRSYRSTVPLEGTSHGRKRPGCFRESSTKSCRSRYLRLGLVANVMSDRLRRKQPRRAGVQPSRQQEAAPPPG
jgi:hypothetical protein